MAEYIEREKVYEMLHAIGGCGAEAGSWADGWDKAIDTAIEELAEIPTADVRSERHGEWTFSGFDGIGYPVWCIACGIRFGRVTSPVAWLEGSEHQYCGNCGAKMDGEDGENND